MTNDPASGRIRLRMTGDVEVFAHIDPPIVKLRGAPGTEIVETVTITPTEKYPFHITGQSLQVGDNVTVEVKAEDAITYRVILTNTRKAVGRYYDILTLTTDSDIRPEIKISLYGNIKAE